MKLIRELHEVESTFITEENGKKTLYIEGPFLVSEKINKNGRLYEYNIMKNEVHRYTEEYINKNRAVGELGHPESPTINPDRISHKIVGLKEDGNQWIGKAKVVDTPMGNIVKGLIESGVQLGISSRGMGSIKNINGTNVVQSDFILATAGDIVMDPSAPGAFLQGIMENVEWIMVDGIWTQQKIEEAQTMVKKANRKDIERVSLLIFENFINRL